jgi:hypothetical protein
VTSALLSLLRSDVGFMSVNFRGRLPALGASDAGNYEALVAYAAADSATPALMRRSLQLPGGGVRRVHGDRPLPGALASALQCRTALVSTWATFFTELRLPGARTLRHAPLVDAGTVPMTDIAIIFRPSAGELAVLLLARSVGRAELERALGRGR